jgi:tetratricopeptide (TPR) repeat protein
MEGITSLVQPAIDLLRRTKLDQEARELERRSLDVVVQRLDRPGAHERSGAAQAQVDVFISYTDNDSSWAKWVDFILREAGYTTKAQLYDFTAGESFLGAMTEALIRSRWVLSLLSPAYLESRWCQEEWQAAHLAKKLVPMRIADCEPEGLLAPIAYLDLVGVSEDEAKERILAELNKRGGADPRPEVRPAFPSSAPSPTRPRFPGKLPTIWNIREERNPYFTGREGALDQLHEALTAGKTAALTQSIVGLGGVGKTQLALEYSYRYASDYEGVWWLHAEEPVILARDYAELAPHLGVAVVPDQGQVIRGVHEKLQQRQRILLIFDNATEPSTLKPYLPVSPGRQVIVTTRAQTWPGAEAQDVHELPLDVAIEFLLKRTGQTDKAAAEDVAKRLGCLALALDQAAGYVVECRKNLHDYAALLAKHGLDVLEKGQPYQYEKTVGTTWVLAFEKVQAKCPADADLLHLCAFLAPDAIYVRDLAGASKHLPERLSKALADELGIDEMKAALLAFSLIRTERDTIAIHRLVSDVMRKRMDPKVRDEWLGTALQVVNELLPVDVDDVGAWPACSRWLGHALTVVNWDEAEVVEPIACARILNQAGSYLCANANYNQAEPLFRRALAISERSLGSTHPHVAACLGNLAGLLQATNRLAEAEPLSRRALAIDEQNLGPSHPNVAIRLNNLAVVLRATNRLAEAEPLFRRALAIDEQNLGPSHPNVALRLINMAGLLKATNRRSEAEPLFRRALSINEQSLGPNHPRVAMALNDLAMLLGATNRQSEAEPLFRRALSIDERSLGPNHPDVAIRLNNLAGLLRDENRLSEAEPLLRRAVNIVESRLGPDHPWTLTFRKNLNKLLAGQGKGKSLLV